METPAMHDQQHRLQQHLDDMATTLSTLTNRHEQATIDRAQLRSFFKQLHGILLAQQENDITAARSDPQLSKLVTDARGHNASLLAQKRECIERHTAKINHMRKKIATTSGHQDRARFEEILSVMEELAADEACKWDMDIMSHWFNSYTKPSVEGSTIHNTETAVETAVETVADKTKTQTAVEDSAGGNRVQVANPKPNTADTGEHKSLIVRALELYADEVTDPLSRRLTEVQREISTLLRYHHEAFVADVDSTLSVLARMQAVPNVGSITEDVSQLKQLQIDVNTQNVISTIVDKAEEQFERSKQVDKESWQTLLLRAEAFRDSNASRNDKLLTGTLELTATMNRVIDTVVARTEELSLGIDALQSEETRHHVRKTVNDLIATLNTT